MNLIRDFLSRFDLFDMLSLAIAALICLTVHEYAHAYASYKLGDPTARLSGRLTMNPLRHIDPIGFIVLVVARFGWAKPVQVDTRYFKKPKRDMALTALAGPVSNFILAFVLLIVLNLFEQFIPAGKATKTIYNIILYTSQLSIGLGIFNLLPISPLDGSKILIAFLPDRIYYTILRYERYGFIILILALYFDVLTGPLATINYYVINTLYIVASLPFKLFS